MIQVMPFIHHELSSRYASGTKYVFMACLDHAMLLVSKDPKN